MTAGEILQSYFAETMQGDLAAVDRYFPDTPDYVLISEDDPELTAIMGWAGRQTSRPGIKLAYGQLLDALEVVDATQAIFIDTPEQVVVTGSFRYRVRAHGSSVTSAWAAHARVRDGMIVFYRFYEDSFAVARAMQNL